MGNIVQPIISQVHDFINTNFEMSFEQEMLLKSMFRQIESPFRLCSTEHKLNEWLTSNKYIQPYEEFTINSEIGPVYQRGNMSYDEINTTGILLPISFQFKQIFE